MELIVWPVWRISFTYYYVNREKIHILIKVSKLLTWNGKKLN
jgi:hypothetical protein